MNKYSLIDYNTAASTDVAPSTSLESLLIVCELCVCR